jgi:hypothetical protein
MVSKFVYSGSFGHFGIMLDTRWARSSDETVFVNVAGSRDAYIEECSILVVTVQVLWAIDVVWMICYCSSL